MKHWILFLVVMLVLKVFPAGEKNGFRFWELLSMSFDEFTVTTDGSLHGRLNGLEPIGFYMKTDLSTSYALTDQDRSFSLRLGEKLVFWRSKMPSSSICMLAKGTPELNGIKFPESMRDDVHYVWIKTEGIEALIGTASRKVYFPEEDASMDFCLPFRTVWSSREDYELWVSGLGYRFRSRKVRGTSDSEKQLSAGLFEYFSASNKVLHSICPSATGITNIQMVADVELRRIVSDLEGCLTIQVVVTNSSCLVSGISFLTQNDKCRRARRYRFDHLGHLIWCERIDRANESGVAGRMLCDLAFEYDEEGKILRAWTPGGNPLMIDKGRKLYFTGERGLVVEFREDLSRALLNLPRMK
ncbi:MAG: hypothetical protein MJ249_12710 [Kiritimatiellae bacterium]|nr:hypothetical protein [Kiritimatiellia bacterium]